MDFKYSETYLYKLHKLTNSLDKIFDQLLRKHADIGLSQFTLLLAVDQHDSVSQREVSAFLGCSPGAISRQVEISQHKGWLQVINNQDDRRSQSLLLTPVGKKVITNGMEVLEEHVFKIFDDHNRSMGLMGHIDMLLSNIKEATMATQIPKARQLFRGDINDAVIKVQKATGIEITKSWWDSKVGNHGSTEQILERFDTAYAKLVQEQTKQ